MELQIYLTRLEYLAGVIPREMNIVEGVVGCDILNRLVREHPQYLFNVYEEHRPEIGATWSEALFLSFQNAQLLKPSSFLAPSLQMLSSRLDAEWSDCKTWFMFPSLNDTCFATKLMDILSSVSPLISHSDTVFPLVLHKLSKLSAVCVGYIGEFRRLIARSELLKFLALPFSRHSTISSFVQRQGVLLLVSRDTNDVVGHNKTDLIASELLQGYSRLSDPAIGTMFRLLSAACVQRIPCVFAERDPLLSVAVKFLGHANPELLTGSLLLLSCLLASDSEGSRAFYNGEEGLSQIYSLLARYLTTHARSIADSGSDLSLSSKVCIENVVESLGLFVEKLHFSLRLDDVLRFYLKMPSSTFSSRLLAGLVIKQGLDSNTLAKTLRIASNQCLSVGERASLAAVLRENMKPGLLEKVDVSNLFETLAKSDFSLSLRGVLDRLGDRSSVSSYVDCLASYYSAVLDIFPAGMDAPWAELGRSFAHSSSFKSLYSVKSLLGRLPLFICVWTQRQRAGSSTCAQLENIMRSDSFKSIATVLSVVLGRDMFHVDPDSTLMSEISCYLSGTEATIGNEKRLEAALGERNAQYQALLLQHDQLGERLQESALRTRELEALAAEDSAIKMNADAQILCLREQVSRLHDSLSSSLDDFERQMTERASIIAALEAKIEQLCIEKTGTEQQFAGLRLELDAASDERLALSERLCESENTVVALADRERCLSEHCADLEKRQSDLHREAADRLRQLEDRDCELRRTQDQIRSLLDEKAFLEEQARRAGLDLEESRELLATTQSECEHIKAQLHGLETEHESALGKVALLGRSLQEQLEITKMIQGLASKMAISI